MDGWMLGMNGHENGIETEFFRFKLIAEKICVEAE